MLAGGSGKGVESGELFSDGFGSVPEIEDGRLGGLDLFLRGLPICS